MLFINLGYRAGAYITCREQMRPSSSTTGMLFKKITFSSQVLVLSYVTYINAALFYGWLCQCKLLEWSIQVFFKMFFKSGRKSLFGEVKFCNGGLLVAI